MDSLEQKLQEFPSITEIPVQWGDMDAAQHVNNVTYLKWVETARVNYFYALEFEVNKKEQEIGFILGYIDCKFIAPLVYPDTVVIGTKIIEMGTDRFMMESHVFSKKHSKLVAISKQRVITYDYKKLQKSLIPEQLLVRLKAFEAKSSPV